MKAHRRAISAALGSASAAAQAVRHPGVAKLRVERGLAAVLLAARGGARYASNTSGLFTAAGERREQLRNDLALQTAEDVAATLGTMKGVLMKLGQMASYVHDGLSPAARRTLSSLQDSVPPMSPELAARVITEELGLPPERAFAAWDPRPIAAASIGQVHRAITQDGRAVAVKVQYPGIAEIIEADLGNVALLRPMLRVIAPAQDVGALVAELRDRIAEELDYRTQARNQQMFARYYDMVRQPGPRTITTEYATAVAGRLLDVRSPLAAYVQLPRSYVILQRINLGLYALLGELSATADWRRISEEIWPFVQAAPPTPIGVAEAVWRAEHPGIE